MEHQVIDDFELKQKELVEEIDKLKEDGLKNMYKSDLQKALHSGKLTIGLMEQTLIKVKADQKL